jgi:hypothetical protein
MKESNLQFTAVFHGIGVNCLQPAVIRSERRAAVRSMALVAGGGGGSLAPSVRYVAAGAREMDGWTLFRLTGQSTRLTLQPPGWIAWGS